MCRGFGPLCSRDRRPAQSSTLRESNSVGMLHVSSACWLKHLAFLHILLKSERTVQLLCDLRNSAVAGTYFFARVRASATIGCKHFLARTHGSLLGHTGQLNGAPGEPCARSAPQMGRRNPIDGETNVHAASAPLS